MREGTTNPSPFPPPDHDRSSRLHALEHSPEDVAGKARSIHAEMLEASPYLRAGNFTEIGVVDLQRLFHLYDRAFFDGLLQRMLADDGAPMVAFRLSRRLTSAAGTTTRTSRFVKTSAGRAKKTDYTITVSTTLLFGTFDDTTRPVRVNGLHVRDRLEALQRIFEHELIHLAEMLAWGRSSCKQENFHRLSRRIFGHEGAYHELVTPRERAAVAQGIHVGDRVRFELEGVIHRGKVNRITRRATVLVENPSGRLFSDGKIYATYYVPLTMLIKEPGAPT